jgi:hypothetical protein
MGEYAKFNQDEIILRHGVIVETHPVKQILIETDILMVILAPIVEKFYKQSNTWMNNNAKNYPRIF